MSQLLLKHAGWGGYAVIDGASGKNSKNMNRFWPVIVTFAFFVSTGF